MTPQTSATTRLNLGSGGEALPGWVNVDNSPAVLLSRSKLLRRALFCAGVLSPQQYEGFSREVVYGDVTRRLSFSPRSVDFIYSSHLIEHLSREQGMRFLLEARRVLKPNGTIRLATPDLALLIEEYRTGSAGDARAGDELMTQLGMFRQLDGGVVKRFISRTFSGYWHQWVYDEGSLRSLLEEAGFQSVQRFGFQAGEFPDLDRIESRPDSLFVQAQAPG